MVESGEGSIKIQMSDCKAQILETQKATALLKKVVKKVTHFKREKIHATEIKSADALLEKDLNDAWE